MVSKSRTLDGVVFQWARAGSPGGGAGGAMFRCG